jgi:hypothetical protein
VNITAEGPSNTLDFYWATNTNPTWHPEQIAAPGTTYSAPSMTTNRGSPQTVETSVVVIMARTGWPSCARVRAGQAGACPLFLFPGAAGVPGVKGGPQGRRAQRGAQHP